ncbi:hypothetical protein [Glaciecola sp. KUL10]|uniref:hypothetical protein n=1 Tax=Glaciecola sp. (strain KUL10) TaxID=2161813 RepID=UPI0011B3C476|nr:hypothetical protein [Glaciecola sp. KUL10]
MIEQTKLTAFLSGIPMGVLVVLSDSFEVSETNEQMFTQLHMTILILAYFFLSMFIFVLSATSFKRRLEYPASSLFSDTKMFIKHHLSIMRSDLVQLMLYFTGAVLGGVVIGTST